MKKIPILKPLAILSVLAALAATVWAAGAGCDPSYPACPPPNKPYTCAARPDYPQYDVGPFLLLACEDLDLPACGTNATLTCNELVGYNSTARIYHCGTQDTFCITNLGTPTSLGRKCTYPYDPCDGYDPDPLPPLIPPIPDPVPTTFPGH